MEDEDRWLTILPPDSPEPNLTYDDVARLLASTMTTISSPDAEGKSRTWTFIPTRRPDPSADN